MIDVVGMDGKALIWHVLCNVEHALKPLDENADEKTRKIWERNMASRRSLNDICESMIEPCVCLVLLMALSYIKFEYCEECG